MAQRRIWSPKCLGGSGRDKEKRMNWRHMLEVESVRLNGREVWGDEQERGH